MTAYLRPTTFGMGTDFDQPVPRLPIPGALTRGGQPELQLTDGLTRGDAVVGRFETSPGLLAVKLAEPTGAVRVTVRLAADSDTAAWWERRVPEHVEPRLPHGTRLLAVRSQGATRGAVLLARRADDFALRAHAKLCFELTADELPADGFLLVEVVDVDGDQPPWTTRRPEHAAVGVRVDAVEVAPATQADAPAVDPGTTLDAATCLRLGLVGTGEKTARHSAVDIRDGVFLAHPIGGLTGPVSWTLRPRLVHDARPDPVPPEPGPVIQKPAPGQPPLTTRDKAMAVARHELLNVRDTATRRARHATVRGARKAARPLDRGLAAQTCAQLLNRGLVQAMVLAVRSGEPVPSTITGSSGGRVTLTCTEPVTEPLAVHVATPRTAVAGARLHWQLVSARYGQP